MLLFCNLSKFVVFAALQTLICRFVKSLFRSNHVRSRDGRYALPAPKDPRLRVEGTNYVTCRGYLSRWNGTRFFTICKCGELTYRCKRCKAAKRVKIPKTKGQNYRLRQSVKNRIRHTLKKAKAKKSDRTMNLIGCTTEELRTHLEKQFVEGMNWENRSEWHIDHRRPCASFDLCDKEQQRMCFHYTNLQPLWATDNLRKSAKFDAETFDYVWMGTKWKKFPEPKTKVVSLYRRAKDGRFALSVPKDKSQRVKGCIYVTQKGGYSRWDGTQLRYVCVHDKSKEICRLCEKFFSVPVKIKRCSTLYHYFRERRTDVSRCPRPKIKVSV